MLKLRPTAAILAMLLMMLPAFMGAVAQVPVPTTDLARIPGGAYRLDPTHASIVFGISHYGFSQLTGTFDRIEGELIFDPDHPEASTLRVVVDAASADANNQIVEDMIRGEQFLRADNHPEIIFEATHIELTGETTGLVTGTLNIRGVSHPATIETRFNGYGVNGLSFHRTLGFSATITISRSQWGMDAFPAMVGDDVTLRIEAEFVRRNFDAEQSVFE